MRFVTDNNIKDTKRDKLGAHDIIIDNNPTVKSPELPKQSRVVLPDTKQKSVLVRIEKKIKLPSDDLVFRINNEKGVSAGNELKRKLNDADDVKVYFSADNGLTRFVSERAQAFLRKAQVCFTYAGAFIVIGLLVYGTFSQKELRLRFGNEVIIDGKSVGFVDHRSDIEDILTRIDGDTKKFYGDSVDISRKVTYVPRILSDDMVTPEKKLEQNIMTTNKDSREAYAFYLNGTLLCAAFSEDEANQAIETVKNDYLETYGDTDVEKVDFSDKIEIRKELVSIGHVRSVDGIVSLLTATKEGEVAYTVAEEDTLWQIARDNDMTIDDIMMLNTGLSELIHPGDEILLKKKVPLVSLESSYEHTVEQVIPPPVEKIMTNELFEGKVEVVTPGQEGLRRVHEAVKKRNGDVVDRVVYEETILKEPTLEVIRVGTKAVPKKGNGNFITPLFGTITSRFGRRSGGLHTGTDFAASTGSTITAADDGVVIHSGWLGGYGKLVKIDHRNGYVTYYAHCSSLSVEEGQEVSKGQQVAKVGSTGNSTGPHLHFEVRKDGEPVDPMSYLD